MAKKSLFYCLTLAFTLVGCLTVKPEQASEQESKIQIPIQYQIGKDIPIAIRDVEEEEPSVAWDGTHFFVVWQYKRNGSYDIYGSQVSVQGEVLNPEGIPISTAPLDQIKPRIQWNGNQYLVVWQDKRFDKNWKVFGARLTASGQVLDTDGIPIAAGPENQGTPSVAWDGKNYFVTWEREGPAPRQWDIYGARVTSEGKVLDENGIGIVTAPQDQYYSGIAWNGKNYFVVWSDKRSGSHFDIYGARVSPDGIILDPAGITLSLAPNDQFFPSISWNGEIFLVAWMDKRQGEGSIYGTRVDLLGKVLDPQGIAIAEGPNFHSLPFVTAREGEFLVVWDEEQKVTFKDIFGLRIDTEGRKLDLQAMPIYTGMERQAYATAVSDGTRYLVIWKDYREGIPFQGDIYGKFLDPVMDGPQIPTPTTLIGEPTQGPYMIHQVSIHPKNTNILYAATSHYGILKSEDGGHRWVLSNQGLSSFTHHAVIVHPRNPEILYAGTWGGGISKSTDGGKTWQEINTGLGDTAVNTIVLHPKNPEMIYAVTESGVFRSVDAGSRWESFNKGLARAYDESFQTLLFLPSRPYRLFLGSNKGVYRWDEQLGQWIDLKIKQEKGITTLAYDPVKHILYAGTLGAGLLKSTDMGKNWGLVSGTSPSWVRQIVIDPTHSSTIYVATKDRGVLKTINDGRQWKEYNAGLSDISIQSLTMDPKNSQVLHAGTYENGIFTSRDGGRTWIAAESIPELTMSEILKQLPLDEDMRPAAEVTMLVNSPEQAKELFNFGNPPLAPPPEFAKCNECHGWVDPLLNIKRTNWRVAANVRDWEFTVKHRMSGRAGLTSGEEDSIIKFLDRYSRQKAGVGSAASTLHPEIPTSSTIKPGIPKGSTTRPEIPASSTIQPQRFRGETPQQMVRRVCSQCHALKIHGQCIAGDCRIGRVHQTGGRHWDFVVDWMRSMGARMTDQEQQIITKYLTMTYPAKPYPLSWTKTVTLPGKGWNVTSLQTLGPYLYAGTEGSGKIFRSADGKEWKEVGNTNEYRVYGITEFKGSYFAGTDTPRAEIWKSIEGQKWEKIATLPDHQSGIISLGTFKGNLYAGTDQARVYRSPDGRLWEQVTAFKDLEQPHWVRIIIEFKGMLYVGTEHGYLYRSVDGRQWEEVGQEMRKGKDLFGIRATAVFKGQLYVGSITHGEIWRTEDGKNWSLCFDATPGKDMGYVASMTVHEDVLYAGIRTYSGFVFRTPDGERWEEVGNLSPHSIEAMAVFKNHLYAGTLIPPEANIYRAALNHR